MARPGSGGPRREGPGGPRDSAVRREAMLAAMTAGVLAVDGAGRCTAAAGPLADLLELPAGWAPAGQSVAALLAELRARGDFGPRAPELEPGDAAALDRLLSDIYLETPGGRVVVVTPSELPDGGRVLTFVDMTRMKDEARMLSRARRDLAESVAEAERLRGVAEDANRAKRAFLAAMSHEMRTPMNGVIGISELLSETPLSAEQAGHVALIRESAEALVGTINELLDFSKIEAGHQTLASAPFGLLDAAEDVLALVAPAAQGKALALDLACDPALPSSVVGDGQRVRQVLVNLVGNAVKFTERGAIRLALERRPGGVRIVVEDTGIGIPEADLGRIFGEFTRVDRAGRAGVEGTGLGLAITHGLVGLMGGEIAVRSLPGMGTAFTVDLPLPAAEGAAPVVAPSKRLAGRRVLIAAGAPEEARSLADWLTAAGAAATVTRSAGAATRLIDAAEEAARPFRLAIVDARGAGPCASALARQVRRRLPGAPIVALGAPGQGPAESPGDTEPADTRIARPLRLSRLVPALEAALGGSDPPSAPAAPPSDNSPPVASPPTARPVVLVADDSGVNRVVVEKLLAGQVAALHMAADGCEAVALYRRHRPDVVLMDLSMPGMDGIAATAAIRAFEHRHGLGRARIVALTAHAGARERRLCLEGGMDGCLAKPLRKADLVRALAPYAAGPSASASGTSAASPDPAGATGPAGLEGASTGAEDG